MKKLVKTVPLLFAFVLAAALCPALAYADDGSGFAMRDETMEEKLRDFLRLLSKNGEYVEYDCADPAGSAPEIVRYLLMYHVASHGGYPVAYPMPEPDDPLGWKAEGEADPLCFDGASFDWVAENIFNVGEDYLLGVRAQGCRVSESEWWYYHDGAYHYGGSNTLVKDYEVDIVSCAENDRGGYDVVYDVSTWSMKNARRYAEMEKREIDGVEYWTLLKNSLSPITDAQKNANPMYRVYNPWSGEHFYTSDTEEMATTVKRGWVNEGIGWTAPSHSGTPVYRLYNSYRGEHHYTVDASERDNLLAVGWSDEGIGWYSDDAMTVPLYREYNPNEPANNHNYTTDRAEHDLLVSLGWSDEGCAWYGL